MNVGDRVRVVSSESRYKGEEGEVIAIVNGQYNVVLDRRIYMPWFYRFEIVKI